MQHVAGIFVLLLLVSGCAITPPPLESASSAFANLKTEIRAAISDVDRQNGLVALVDELDEMMMRAAADQRNAEQQIRELNQNYDATPEDFAGIFNALNEKKTQRRQRLVEITASARVLTTDREWRKINRFKTPALVSALEAASQTGAPP